MPSPVSSSSNLLPTATTLAADINTQSQDNQSRPSSVGAAGPSGTPGAGTGYKWFNKLFSCLCPGAEVSPPSSPSTSTTNLLATAGEVPSYLQEEWGQFFTRHFKSFASIEPGENGTIDTPEFHERKKDYVRQLKEKVKGSPDIYVSFHDLPECRADNLSSHLMIKELVIPEHVSLFLAKLTLTELIGALQKDAGKKKKVHIDFGRRPAAETSHSGSEGFFNLQFKDIVNVKAMAHFGTLEPEGMELGIRNIPGLSVTADLSGLKIENAEELARLHNLLLRSTITGLHIDLSLIQPRFQGEAWSNLARMLSNTGTEYQRSLVQRDERGENVRSGGTRASSGFLTRRHTVEGSIRSEAISPSAFLRRNARSKTEPSGNLTRRADAGRAMRSGTEYLRDLTLTVPMHDGEASYGAANKLDAELSTPGCHLKSLILIGGNWGDAAKAKLSDTVKKRQAMGRPIAITVDGQQLV